MTRDKQIKVQVDEAEKAVIENKARLAGMSTSNFLRELALGFTTHIQEPSQQVSQVSQVDPRVDTLEANVLSLQVQLLEVNQKLANLANEHSHQESVYWNEGDIIDSRYGKRYNLLRTSEYQEQNWDKQKNALGKPEAKTRYYWYKSLGLICSIVGESRSGQRKFEIEVVLEPGSDLKLTNRGNFIHPDGMYYFKEPEVSQVSQEVSRKVSVCVKKDISKTITLAPKNVADELPSPDLSQEERSQPEATSVFPDEPSADTIAPSDTNKVPSQMSGAEFRDYYSLSSGDYGLVINDARAKGFWVSPNSLQWKVDGEAKKAVWTQVTIEGSPRDTMTPSDTIRPSLVRLIKS